MASCPDPLPRIGFALDELEPASTASDGSEEADDAAILDGLDGGRSEGSESISVKSYDSRDYSNGSTPTPSCDGGTPVEITPPLAPPSGIGAAQDQPGEQEEPNVHAPFLRGEVAGGLATAVTGDGPRPPSSQSGGKSQSPGGGRSKYPPPRVVNRRSRTRTIAIG